MTFYKTAAELDEYASSVLEGKEPTPVWIPLDKSYVESLPVDMRSEYIESFVEVWSVCLSRLKHDLLTSPIYLDMLRDVLDAALEMNSTYPIYVLDTPLSQRAQAHIEGGILEVFADRIPMGSRDVKIAARSLLVDILACLSSEDKAALSG